MPYATEEMQQNLSIMFSQWTLLMTATGRNKQPEFPFMSADEIQDVLKTHMQDCPEELIAELAEHLIR